MTLKQQINLQNYDKDELSNELAEAENIMRDYKAASSAKIKELEDSLQMKETEIEDLTSKLKQQSEAAQKQKAKIKIRKLEKSLAQVEEKNKCLEKLLQDEMERNKLMKMEEQNNNETNEKLMAEFKEKVKAVVNEHIKIREAVNSILPQDKNCDNYYSEDSDDDDDKTTSQLVSLEDYNKLRDENQGLMTKVFTLTCQRMKLKEQLYSLSKESLDILSGF